MSKIISILRVEDTRAWEEGPDDRFYPIPGSGIENQCGRCGRNHVIHATVGLDDGKTMIVGTGCMHADESETGNRVKSILSAYKIIRETTKKLAQKETLDAQNKSIQAQVDSLPLPPIEKAQHQRSIGEYRPVVGGFKMGDHFVQSDSRLHPTDAEKETLIWLWKEAQAVKLGRTHDMKYAHEYIKSLKKRISDAQDRIEKKVSGS